MSLIQPSMRWLDRTQAWRSLLLVLAISSFLTIGFVPTARHFAVTFTHWVGLPPGPFQALVPYVGFPALAALFCFSLRPLKTTARTPARELVTLSLLPLALSLLFGIFDGAPPVWTLEAIPRTENFFWLVVCIPLGEELLFRGWLYTLLERLWPHTIVTPTNPLPVVVIGSALAFSLWHLQNMGNFSNGFVLFQVGYTFFIGLWLGYLRWKSGSLGPPIVAHGLLNLFPCLV